MHIPTSGFETVFGLSCLGLFSHIKQLYALEEHKTLKVAHTLKKASLNPSNLAKTSPQYDICKCFIVLFDDIAYKPCKIYFIVPVANLQELN